MESRLDVCITRIVNHSDREVTRMICHGNFDSCLITLTAFQLSPGLDFINNRHRAAKTRISTNVVRLVVSNVPGIDASKQHLVRAPYPGW